MDDFTKELIKREENSYQRYDTAILSVTSGAVALSVTIIVKDITHIHTFILCGAWIFWFVSLCTQITAHLIAAQAMRNEIQKITVQTKHDNAYAGLPTVMNYVSLITFIIGSLLFFLFVFFNFIK